MKEKENYGEGHKLYLVEAKKKGNLVLKKIHRVPGKVSEEKVSTFSKCPFFVSYLFILFF